MNAPKKKRETADSSAVVSVHLCVWGETKWLWLVWFVNIVCVRVCVCGPHTRHAQESTQTITQRRSHMHINPFAYKVCKCWLETARHRHLCGGILSVCVRVLCCGSIYALCA